MGKRYHIVDEDDCIWSVDKNRRIGYWSRFTYPEAIKNRVVYNIITGSLHAAYIKWRSGINTKLVEVK